MNVSCAQVRAHLYEYIDDECDDGGTVSRAEIAAHLSVCASCDGGYHFEMVLRRTVRRCCADPAPPGDLRTRILAELARCDGAGSDDGGESG